MAGNVVAWGWGEGDLIYPSSCPGLFPALAQPDQEESGSVGAGQLMVPGEALLSGVLTRVCCCQHQEGATVCASPAPGRGAPPCVTL